MPEGFIDVDLDDIPDEVPQLSPGVHLLEVKGYDTVDSGEKGTTHKFQFECVDEDGPDTGRKVWDNMNFKYEVALVKFGKLVRAAGLPKTGKGLDPTLLIGKRVKAKVKSRTYKDEDTGDTKTATNIDTYLSARESVGAES